MPPRQLSAGPRHTLGVNLVEARERAGLSRENAADKAGVGRSRLSQWENGRETPGAESLLLLAVAYGCPLDYLFSGVDAAYDAIIERRIPIDAKRHYAGKIAGIKQAAIAAMNALTGDKGTAPTPVAPVGGRPTARGKSRSTRARRRTTT